MSSHVKIKRLAVSASVWDFVKLKVSNFYVLRKKRLQVRIHNLENFQNIDGVERGAKLKQNSQTQLKFSIVKIKSTELRILD